MYICISKYKMKMKYIAYYRVSTKKQGESGLGLKAIESIKHKASHNPHNKRALGFVSLMDYKNMKLREIAEALNSNGFLTSTGKQFSTTQVIRLLKKIA